MGADDGVRVVVVAAGGLPAEKERLRESLSFRVWGARLGVCIFECFCARSMGAKRD